MTASARSDISISILSPASGNDTVILSDGDLLRGSLADIIEPDGEDILLAEIAGDLVEVPKALSSALWSLVGKRIWLACIGGKIRFAEVSA